MRDQDISHLHDDNRQHQHKKSSGTTILNIIIKSNIEIKSSIEIKSNIDVTSNIDIKSNIKIKSKIETKPPLTG